MNGYLFYGAVTQQLLVQNFKWETLCSKVPHTEMVIIMLSKKHT